MTTTCPSLLGKVFGHKFVDHELGRAYDHCVRCGASHE